MNRFEIITGKKPPKEEIDPKAIPSLPKKLSGDWEKIGSNGIYVKRNAFNREK
jgi:hypothetical protein